MKLTIDSTEALEDTLRVVGAFYNVTLEVSPSAGDNNRSDQTSGTDASTPARPARASRGRAQRRPGKRSRRGPARSSANGKGRVDTAAVRSWARENGYTVADRGRVPAEVLTAYRDAQPA